MSTEERGGWQRLADAARHAPRRASRFAFCRHCQGFTLRVKIAGAWQPCSCHPVAGGADAA